MYAKNFISFYNYFFLRQKRDDNQKITAIF